MHIWDVRENCVALVESEKEKLDSLAFLLDLWDVRPLLHCASNNNNGDMLAINLMLTRSKQFEDVTEFLKSGREEKIFEDEEGKEDKNLNLQEARRPAGVSYNPHHRKVEELCSHVWL